MQQISKSLSVMPTAAMRLSAAGAVLVALLHGIRVSQPMLGDQA